MEWIRDRPLLHCQLSAVVELHSLVGLWQQTSEELLWKALKQQYRTQSVVVVQWCVLEVQVVQHRSTVVQDDGSPQQRPPVRMVKRCVTNVPA